MKDFIIKRLLQSSTWFGLITLVAALWLPRNISACIAIAILCSDDDKMRVIFASARARFQEWLA